MIDREITIKIAPRPDGGLRIYSDDLPGLVLSSFYPVSVLRDLSQALIVLLTDPIEKPPLSPQERLADIFDALNAQDWSLAAALAYPYRRRADPQKQDDSK